MKHKIKVYDTRIFMCLRHWIRRVYLCFTKSKKACPLWFGSSFL